MSYYLKAVLRAFVLLFGVLLVSKAICDGGFWYAFGGGFLTVGSVVWFVERK